MQLARNNSQYLRYMMSLGKNIDYAVQVIKF